MKNEFRDEAEVLIWTVGGGHAALELRSDQKDLADRKFISWWPGDTTQNPLRRVTAAPHKNRYEANRAEMGNRTRELLDGMSEAEIAARVDLQPRPGQKQLTRGGFNDGEWGQSAQERIRLPLVGTQSKDGAAAHYFGLYGEGIGVWWAERKGSHVGYRYLSATINCSGTVTEAMVAGGANVFSAKPAAPIVSPNAVRNWSVNLRARFDTLNANFRECIARVNASTYPIVMHERDNVAPELLDVASYLDRAGAADNAEQRKIEAALRAYHQTPWGAPITSATYRVKVTQLVAIVDATHASLGQFPTASQSPRYGAMLVLCAQIAHKLDTVGDPPYSFIPAGA